MDIKIGWADLILISPMILLFLTSLIPVTIKVLNGNREPRPSVNLLIVMVGLLLTAAVGGIVNVAPESRQIFVRSLTVDGISTWMNYLIVFITAASIFLSVDHPAIKGKQFSEFLFLILNCAVGMMVVVGANDLIVTFIGIEMMSLPLYLLIALSHEERLSKEAAFKYFILGSLASAIFLYGIAFIYGTAGTTDLKELATQLPELLTGNKLALVGVIAVLVGFCFKVSVFPFHFWAPDVYQGAATPLTGFMATAVKAVTFVAFLRFVMSKPLLSAGSETAIDILQWLAVFTMLAGNVAAILQNNIKRVLAYSSIAHSGYLMVGLLAAGLSETPAYGTGALLFYLFGYALMTLGAFAFITLFEKFEGSLVSIDDLKGVASNHPMLALGLTICLLSLAGIPPLLGFFGKFYIFMAAVNEGLLWLALWGVLNSVISVYYYLRPVVVMYMQTRDTGYDPVQQGYLLSRVTLGVTAAMLIVGGIAASPILKAVQFAVGK